MLTFASGATDPQVGPGRLIGLLVAALLCYLYWFFDPKRDRGEVDPLPSPDGETAPPAPEKRQVAAVSSQVSHPRDDETSHPAGWWGAITRDAKGVGRRVYQQARHIAQTGDSATPGELLPADNMAPGDLVPFDDIDVPLEDTPAYHERAETREEYADRCFRSGAEKAAIVAGLQAHFRVSRAQAYRVAGAAEARIRVT